MKAKVTRKGFYGTVVAAEVPFLDALVPMLRDRVEAGTTPVELHLDNRIIRSREIEAALRDHDTDDGVLKALGIGEFA
jgi:hypothetical protein